MQDLSTVQVQPGEQELDDAIWVIDLLWLADLLADLYHDVKIGDLPEVCNHIKPPTSETDTPTNQLTNEINSPITVFAIILGWTTHVTITWNQRTSQPKANPTQE